MISHETGIRFLKAGVRLKITLLRSSICSIINNQQLVNVDSIATNSYEEHTSPLCRYE